MIFALIAIFLVIFIFQISILESEKKEKKRIFWEIYFSSIVAELMSLLVVYAYYIYYLGMTFSVALFLMMLLGIVGLANIVLIILGIIFNLKQKKSFKNENKEISKTKFKIPKIILTFVFIWVIIFGCLSIPRVYKSKLEKYVEQYTINYMNSKYGDGDFKVTNVKKDYTGGFFGTPERWNGFVVYVKSNYVPESIYVSLDGINEDSLEVSYDSLILDYYQVEDDESFYQYLTEQKERNIQEDFAPNFNLSIKLPGWSMYKVPENYGHIPSKEELADLIRVDVDDIIITIKDKRTPKEQLDYLRELASFSIKYFDTNEDINILYIWEGASGYIEIRDDIVTIKINDIIKDFNKETILVK